MQRLKPLFFVHYKIISWKRPKNMSIFFQTSSPCHCPSPKSCRKWEPCWDDEQWSTLYNQQTPHVSSLAPNYRFRCRWKLWLHRALWCGSVAEWLEPSKAVAFRQHWSLLHLQQQCFLVFQASRTPATKNICLNNKQVIFIREGWQIFLIV